MNETKLHSDDIEKSNQKLLGMYFIIKTVKLMTCFRENGSLLFNFCWKKGLRYTGFPLVKHHPRTKQITNKKIFSRIVYKKR